MHGPTNHQKLNTHRARRERRVLPFAPARRDEDRLGLGFLLDEPLPRKRDSRCTGVLRATLSRSRKKASDTCAEHAHDDLMRTRADLVRATYKRYLRRGLYQTRAVQSREEVRVRLVRAGWEGRQCGELRRLWERVDEPAAVVQCVGERGREGAGVQDVCDIVCLACVLKARRRDGPHEVILVGFGDEERCNWVLGCSGRGGQKQKGRRDGAASEVEEVGFL